MVGYKISDARKQQLRIERLGYVRIRSTVIALNTLFVERAGSKQDNRNMTSLQFPFQTTAALYPVHARHHDIGNNHIRHVFHGKTNACCPIRRIQHTEFLNKQRLHIMANIGIIINDKHNRTIFFQNLIP